MTTEAVTAKPTKMSEIADGKFKVADDYVVEITGRTLMAGNLLVSAGFNHDSHAASFEHESLLAKYKRVHEYKHYRAAGSKFWTRKAGIDLLFCIPLENITIIPEKHYSYVKALIGGEQVTFNVSGGSADGGWSDWIGERVSLCTNISRKTLKALADAAIPKSAFGTMPPELEHDPEEEARHDRLVTECVSRKRAVAEVDSGKTITIVLGTRYSIYESKKAEVSETLRRGTYGIPAKKKNPAKGFVAKTMGVNFRIKFSQVDWYLTALENGWAQAPVPTECVPA